MEGVGWAEKDCRGGGRSAEGARGRVTNEDDCFEVTISIRQFFLFPSYARTDGSLRQSINVAFCDILGPTLLVGSLHVLHRCAIPDLKIKYYGCFLYRSHLFMVKVRRRVFYEPREWLPVRLFELVDVPQGEGKLFPPHRVVPFADLQYEQDYCRTAFDCRTISINSIFPLRVPPKSNSG